MPGYHLREHGPPLPEEAEPIGFLDFLRELSGEAPAVPRFWNVAVSGLEEVLFAAGGEADELAREIYRRLNAAASLLDKRLATVHLVFQGRLQRGDNLWSEYRGARLSIGLIFGSPPPQTGPGGQRVFLASFHLSS